MRMQIKPGDTIILLHLILFCEQFHKSHTARFPYPTTYNIQNKDAHIFVLNCVLCDMGHVHCGIY